MKSVFFSLIAAGLFVVNPFGYLKAEKESVEKEYEKIAKSGTGVYLIQKDGKGRITSCIIVGEARISTALGKGKGLENARQKADLACSAEFVKWLKQEIKVYQSVNEESVTLMEGKEENGGNELKEIGKAVEKNSVKMESISQGLVRGLQNAYKSIDGDGKNFIIIKGFKTDNANATKKLAKDLASDEPVAVKSANKKPSDKVESGSVTAPGAEDFLPKKKK